MTDSEHVQAVKDAIGAVLDARNAAVREGLHVQLSITIPDTLSGDVDVDRVGLVRVFRSIYASDRNGPVRPPRPQPPGPPGG